MEYKEANGIYAEITYKALFDNYSVYYGGKQYYYPKSDSYQIFCGKSAKFETKEECLEFCKSIGVKVIKEFYIDHPLAHGLPDCRAISETMNKYL